MKIVTHFAFPPIPYRSHDWVAYIEEDGLYGYGETEQEAIADLKELLEEEEVLV